MSTSVINSINQIDPQDFTTSTGDNHDVALASSILMVTATSDDDALTGLVPPMAMDGMQVWVVNISAANTLVINNNDAGSTEGYRFILGGGSTTLTLEPGQGQQFTLVVSTGWVAVRPGTYA